MRTDAIRAARSTRLDRRGGAGYKDISQARMPMSISINDTHCQQLGLSRPRCRLVALLEGVLRLQNTRLKLFRRSHRTACVSAKHGYLLKPTRKCIVIQVVLGGAHSCAPLVCIECQTAHVWVAQNAHKSNVLTALCKTTMRWQGLPRPGTLIESDSMLRGTGRGVVGMEPSCAWVTKTPAPQNRGNAFE
jgi:hypothetical protein